jgi:nucleoside 2-deoxyribosyltransferase
MQVKIKAGMQEIFSIAKDPYGWVATGNITKDVEFLRQFQRTEAAFFEMQAELRHDWRHQEGLEPWAGSPYEEWKTIYLAGPIADRTDAECRGWREKAKQLWKGQCLDPMRRDYRGVNITEEIAAKIVADDLIDIDASDGLLVYFDKPSVGTSMEIFYARSKNKPVVVIHDSGGPVSPWIINHAHVAPNMDEAIETLKELL